MIQQLQELRHPIRYSCILLSHSECIHVIQRGRPVNHNVAQIYLQLLLTPSISYTGLKSGLEGGTEVHI